MFSTITIALSTSMPTASTRLKSTIMFSVVPRTAISVKADQHRKRNRQPHEHRVAQAQEDQQHHHHQQEARRDVVLQLLDHHVDVVRHVHHLGQLHSGGRPGPPAPPRPADQAHGVDARPLLQAHRHARRAVQPRDRRQVLEGVRHRRDVGQVDRPAAALGQQDLAQLRTNRNSPGMRTWNLSPATSMLPADTVTFSCAMRPITRPSGTVGDHPRQVDLHPDLALARPGDIGALDARQPLEPVLQVLRQVLQPVRDPSVPDSAKM
jgi:hypothetical protein